MIPLIGQGSIFVLSVEAHRRERRLVMPIFHGDRMRTYCQTMQETAIEHVMNRNGAETLSTASLMTNLSLEIIVRTIFGGDDRETAQRMIPASTQLVASAHPRSSSRRTHLPFLGISPWDRWRKAEQDYPAF